MNGSFTHTRTPTSNLDPNDTDTDTFYQGTAGVGYAINNLAFDLGFTIARDPLQAVESIGGSFGLTYVFVPGDFEPADYQDRALISLHTQIYEKQEEKPPLFWARFGYIFNTMNSGLLNFPDDVGRETAFTMDFYYPHSEDLLFNMGASFHGYDDARGFYDRAFQNATSTELQLLASTVQGLPHTTLSLQATWQLTPRDAFIPRYQASEIDSSRHWAHTADLGWRHRYFKHWYATATWEASVLDATTTAGIFFEILYIF